MHEHKTTVMQASEKSMHVNQIREWLAWIKIRKNLDVKITLWLIWALVYLESIILKVSKAHQSKDQYILFSYIILTFLIYFYQILRTSVIFF